LLAVAARIRPARVCREHGAHGRWLHLDRLSGRRLRGESVTEAATPSPKSRILIATALAAIVAAIILVVAVLPAEYGIDPLGTGKALGLTALSGGSGAPA